MAGKQHQCALLWINRDVVHELHWFAQHICDLSGVHVLSSVAWSFNNLPPLTFLGYTDVLEMGLGFWFPSLHSGYVASLSPSHSLLMIFFLEALAVLATIQQAASILPHGAQLAIFTDNFNTVGMFNMLAALPQLNWLLLLAVDTLLAHDLDFHVFHIPEQGFASTPLNPLENTGGGIDMMEISPLARQPVREAWPLKQLIFEHSLSLGFALHPNTTHAYLSHLNSYLMFCQLHHFPVNPTPDTLSFYVVFMAHHIQPCSIDNYL